MLEDYIQRDWCGQKYHNSEDSFKKFEAKHESAIVKPLDLNAGGGKGIRIISRDEISDRFSYCRENNYLVEELIVQHDEMNRVYPHSINTIRFVTVRGKLLDAVLRIGHDGAQIDNLSAGGIACPVDIETGIVIGTGRNYFGNEYLFHPNTQTVLPGFMIPHWDKCKELIIQASKRIMGIPIIGWDIAIMNDGPTIVEINEGTEIEALQVPFKKGYRYLIWK